MEDLVALEATLKSGAKRYFITWGRVFSAVDPEPLIECVRPYVNRQFDEDVPNIRVCDTLREASHAPYFFEALFDFANWGIPFGEDTYEPWAAKMREELALGKQLYYLGADG